MSQPDYRLIQLLIEEVLYVYPAEWIDIFWEMANRELVRRLLDAFPQLSWVRSEMSVLPSDLLPIMRMSAVQWRAQDVLLLAGPVMAPFYRPLPDACYYPSPAPAFNIGAPRYLLSSLTKLYKTLAGSPDVADSRLALSFVPTCLAAAPKTYDELLALCTVWGTYDALILPKAAAHGLARLSTVGKLTGLVEVKQKASAGGREQGVAEHLLHSLVGEPPAYTAETHASAREIFFNGHTEATNLPASVLGMQAQKLKAPKMLLEARFAAPLTLRGYTVEPAFEGEPLELVVPKLTPQVQAALAKLMAALKP